LSNAAPVLALKILVILAHNPIFFFLFLLKNYLKRTFDRKSLRQPVPQSCKFRFKYNRKIKLVNSKKQMPHAKTAAPEKSLASFSGGNRSESEHGF